MVYSDSKGTPRETVDLREFQVLTTTNLYNEMLYYDPFIEYYQSSFVIVTVLINQYKSRLIMLQEQHLIMSINVIKI